MYMALAKGICIDGSKLTRFLKKTQQGHVALTKNTHLSDTNKATMTLSKAVCCDKVQVNRFIRCGEGGCERPAVIWVAVLPKANPLTLLRKIKEIVGC